MRSSDTCKIKFHSLVCERERETKRSSAREGKSVKRHFRSVQFRLNFNIKIKSLKFFLCFSLPLNGRCSHICVPAPQLTENSAKTSCLCPHGLKLDIDGLNCITDGQFLNYADSSSYFYVCSVQFTPLHAMTSYSASV